ncbi:hypothetical protein [Sphaerisporangium corydalis]|uniref:Galactose mutarotase n=1 Tax=Sphaerisporangium corydalis TaxID=1441875 RepID=A0ABV9EAC0_9ACTN|nr:hypothetical protein [Sphaerisporangium corydalis]
MSAPVPLRARFDPALGGRWTSLAGGGREWLWSRDEPARAAAVPGAAFADAGGLEECVPTIRGLPDHGDAWSRPWHTPGPGPAGAGSFHGRAGAGSSNRPAGLGLEGGPAGADSFHGRAGAGVESGVRCADFELVRVVTHEAGAVVADYRLSASPGYTFVWAAHALLDLGEDARVLAPPGTPVRLYPEAAPPGPGGRTAPPGSAGRPVPYVEGLWPMPFGVPLDRLGPDDGTAVGAILRHGAVRVTDGGDTLSLRVEAPTGVPVSTALWRNLGGFPAGAPYRSVGVEPMLGAVFDLAEAGPGDAAVVPPSGELTWRLVLTAERVTIPERRNP